VVAARGVMRQSLFAGDDAIARPVDVVSESLAASRLLTYALALGGAALLIALVALVMAVAKL